MKPLLVGEANPYGSDPQYALYPLPKQAAGYRLARLIMGVQMTTYLQRFDRINLCPSKWNISDARRMASEIRNQNRTHVVLCGRKVATAFDWGSVPQYTKIIDTPTTYILIPHPSGLNREWAKPDSYDRARQILIDSGVLNSGDVTV